MEAKKNLVVNFYAGAEEIGLLISRKLNNLWKEENIKAQTFIMLSHLNKSFLRARNR